MQFLVPLLIAAVGMGLLLLLNPVPVRYNVRSLMVRWRVTLMTSLAFTMVVGLLTVMLAFVNGMMRLTESTGNPGNVLVMSDGATDELFSNLGYADNSDIEYGTQSKGRVLRDEAGKPLCSREVYLVVNQPVPPGPGDRPKRRFLQVRGIDDPVISGRVHNLVLYPGGAWFSPAGVQTSPDDPSRQAIQAVLGEGIAQELGRDHGKDRLEVGDRFEVGGRQWVVTGIMRSLGSTFGSEIWAKRALVGPLFGKEAMHTSIVLRTASAADAKALAQDLTKTFKKSAVQALPEDEYYAKLSATNKQFLYAIMVVVAIMAIGGVFGVMNTMFAAITQRTRDIGVLRILGFAPWQVLVSFFVESLWIALIGGALGCLIGYCADGFTATSIVSGGQGGGGKSVVFEMVVDGNVLATGMFFALLMGGVGGFLPALSAMRLKPLEAVH